MANLPPLRTVRDPRSAAPVVAPTPATPVAPTQTPAGKTIPSAAAKLLAELNVHGILDADAADTLATKVGDRLSTLNSADRVLDALVQHKMLTGYQRSRVAGGTASGLVFGNYRVLDRIGGGTIGIVFLAEHLVLRRKVAIKVLPEEPATPPEALARFKTEAELLARVHHPNVIGVFDAGVLQSPGPGQPILHYLVMELVNGKDWEHTVYEMGKLPVPLASALGRQAAAGLAAAHANNLIHRDVKPSNILLTDTRRVKLIDFGLARHFGSTLTPRPGLLGSVEFMAPEQATDAATAGPPADVYGLGATLFWTLTGELPFVKYGKMSEAVHALRTDPPMMVSKFRPDVPGALVHLIDRTLRKKPTERPTAAEFAAELERFATPTTYPSVPVPDTAPPDGEKYAVQHLEDILQAIQTTADQSSAAVLKCMAEIARRRGETKYDQARIQEYVRSLLAALREHPHWVGFADPVTVEEVVGSAAARNVGLISLPDEMTATDDPFAWGDDPRYHAHTTAGSELLTGVAGDHGANLRFLRTAQAVIRHHHERWDGNGYPDKLARERIPHAARVVVLADVYDALRKPSAGEPGLSHLQAVDAILHHYDGHFDPNVTTAFRNQNLEFEAIFEEIQEPPPEPPPGAKLRSAPAKPPGR